MANNSPQRAVRLPPPPLHYRHGSNGGLKADASTPMTDKEEEKHNTEMVGLNSSNQPFYFRRCERIVATSIMSVPNDVLFAIFSRLPAHCIYDQARLVCRKWYFMVRSQAFINEHLQHSRYGLLLNIRFRPVFFVKPSAEGKVETHEYPYEIRSNFTASCNGLILEYLLGTRGLCIVNPATRQRFILPSFFGKYITVTGSGLAYAAASMEFKVALPHICKRGSDESFSLEFYILTVGVDECWRNVQMSHLPVSVFLSEIKGAPLITDGFMHWPTRNHVWSLNVETEVFSMIPFPEEASTQIRNEYKQCQSTGRCLCLLWRVDRTLLWKLWELNAETGEWRKLSNMDLRDKQGTLERILGVDDLSLRVVGWLDYPELIVFDIVDFHTTWISYNLRSHEIESYHHRRSGLSNPKIHKSSLLWSGES